MIWMFFVNVDQKFVDAEVFLAAFGKQSLIEQCEKIWLSSLERKFQRSPFPLLMLEVRAPGLWWP
jgi:hypothetical protein